MSAIVWTKRMSQNVISVGDEGEAKCCGRRLVVVSVQPLSYRWLP